MSLKAIAEQELARLRSGEMGHETKKETELKQVKQPVSCFIDAASRFMPVKHDQAQKTAENEVCFTVSFPRGETHETSLPEDILAGVRRLKSMRPPRLVTPEKWPIVVADALEPRRRSSPPSSCPDEGWAATALAMNSPWVALELFGAVTDLAGDPYSDGLAVWLSGRKLLAIDEKLAVVRDGQSWAYYNRREQVGARLLWELGQ